MFFRIDRKMMNTVSGISTGVIYAEGIDNAKSCPEIEALLKGEVEKAAKELAGTDLHSAPFLSQYREALKSFGINPVKYPCSIEAILARIIKKGEFPSINPIVDLANYISIKYRIPVGVHDADTFEGDLCVRPACEDDCKAPENGDEGDPLNEGEPVYVTGNSVRTRRFFWRQTKAGRITENAGNVIIPLDGFIDNKNTVEEAQAELLSLIEKYFGVKAESGMTDSENSEFRFGKMTPEEKAVEDLIAVMLKGVAQYTNISDIRKKAASCLKEGRPLRIKLGLDPSAPDIHIGHAVVLRKIRQLQDLGHMAVIIIGDYTGMIGDPSGKSKTRKQLSREDVERNAETYMEQIFKIIDRDKTEMHYNSEWLSKMTFGDVIELASKCTVARMLERDDFNNRYTNHLPLSVHEFFYPLMQAYDSVAIRADIELGGTDQTFNILMGRNIQRDYGQEPQLTLFMPLLEGTDGVEKMSKSLGNYVGISEEPAVIYEKIMKIPDDKIIKYFDLCTDMHPSEVEKYQAALDGGENPRDVKMVLAHEITELYCGKENADAAEERFKSVFQKNQVPDDIPSLALEGTDALPAGERIIAALVKGGYYKSKNEVRRLFSQGAASLNDEKVTDPGSITDVKNGDVLKLGKNRFFSLSC
ncbi:MAG: tyrosine--tRNA ligase [Lachnospiraceae bacterium]|nr:tyrosine--tRNA ligase [Lachnospiraceae bacterium]